MTADIVTAEPDVVALADTFHALMRTFGKARARLLAAAEHDLEWTAHVVLKAVASGEPRRAAEVAEALQSDPSTVSRQVAVLVREGYLERRADPADGRASLLVLTPKGSDLLAEHDRIRLEYFARVLEGWSPGDVKRFTALLQRFHSAYEAMSPDWLTERVPSGTGRPRSKN